MWPRRLKKPIQWQERRSSSFASLINILLVLMACFAVFAALGDRNAFEIKFPGCGFGGTGSANESVVLTVSAHQTYYWNKKGPFPLENLPGQLTAWKKTVSTPQLLVAGDETARFGDTIQVINEIRHQGIEHYTVETRIYPQPSFTH